MANEVGTSPLSDDTESMNWFNAGWADQRERLRIGRMIAEQRKQLGLSQRQLAERAYITPANLANIELGRYAMGLDIFRRIVEAMGVQLDLVKKPNNGEQ
jgi:ribosome-binding protein aMBF1 (putative translation factor)